MGRANHPNRDLPAFQEKTMSRKAALIGLFLFLVYLCSASAQGNPFLSSGPKEKRIDRSYPNIFQKIIYQLNDIQRDLYEKMSSLTQTVKEGRNPGVLFILIGICFVYGLIHALGPGHGKLIAISYFLSRRATPVKGVFMGGLIALLHAGSATAIVLIVYITLKSSYLSSMVNREGLDLFFGKA